ncbi:MAG: hypothetical protein WCV84_05930 [Patescibacteria group bacterium]
MDQQEPSNPTVALETPTTVVAEPTGPKPPEHWFKLNFPHEEAHKSSPGVIFTWCLHPDLVKELQQRNICHPALLVVAVDMDKMKGLSDWIKTNSPQNHEIEGRVTALRVVFPLDQGMGRIEFHRPGRYCLLATIIAEQAHTKDSTDLVHARRLNALHSMWRDRSNGWHLLLLNTTALATGELAFDTQPSTYGLEDFTAVSYFSHLFVERDKDGLAKSVAGVEETEIEIDESLFAKEPPQWLQNWGNLLFDTSPRNECDFRRRLILAFTLQPFLVAIWLLFRTLVYGVIAFFLALTGHRIKLSAMLQSFGSYGPFRRLLNGPDIFEDEGLWTRTRKDKTTRPWWQAILLMPITWVVGWGILELLVRIVERAPKFSLGVMGGVAFCVMAGILAYHLMARSAHLAAQPDVLAQRTMRFYKTRLEPLTCTLGGPQDATLKALPPSHRTLIVRFLDLKQRVCLPFRG